MISDSKANLVRTNKMFRRTNKMSEHSHKCMHRKPYKATYYNISLEKSGFKFLLTVNISGQITFQQAVKYRRINIHGILIIGIVPIIHSMLSQNRLMPEKFSIRG